MLSKFDGWANLFWIQFKQYFSNVTSWLTLIFVPIIFAFGLGAAIGVATGFIPALCMILIVLQGNVFSNCYFSFKKSTLNENMRLTSFSKFVEYTTILAMVFFVSLIGMFFAIMVYAIDTELLPILGIDQFLATAPFFEVNPTINAPYLVYLYLYQLANGVNPIYDTMKESINAAQMVAPNTDDIIYKFESGGELIVLDARYITSWLYFEWDSLFYFFLEVTVSTVTISLLFTSFSANNKTYFLFMFGYLIAFIVFGGVMGPEYNYANPDGSFSTAGNFAGMPPRLPAEEGVKVTHSWMFYVEHLNPIYYINQWAFTIMGTATLYKFEIAYVDPSGMVSEQSITLYQSMTPFLRMSYDSSITPYLLENTTYTTPFGDITLNYGDPNPQYYLGMTSPRFYIENAIPDTKRLTLSLDDSLYNMLIYMPWVWSGFYIIATAIADYYHAHKS